MKINNQIKVMLGVLSLSCTSWGEVKLGTPFADGMVLQREREVPVWGTADAGEKIKVTFAGKEVFATANADGKWLAKLPKMAASKESRVLTVVSEKTKEQKTISDVLVGEVWYVCGQSNTEFKLVDERNPHYCDRQGYLVGNMTRNPFIRFVYASNRKLSVTPKTQADYPVCWKKFMPENLLAAPSFSAMAVYFALDVYTAIDVPIGLVGSYRGATNIDCWLPLVGYEGKPALKEMANWPIKSEKEWTKQCAKGVINSAQQQPSVLWNEMVEPWCPMAMRGFLWYQGCNNAWARDLVEMKLYREKMHALYDGWAKKFENPDLKLFFVQLAPYQMKWYELQLSQAQFAAEEKNAGMVTTCDIGNLSDIHPHEKGTIGKRLAALAMKHAYGFDLVADAPTLKSMRAEKNQLILSFNDAEAWYVYDENLDVCHGFELAGEDGKWKKAFILNADNGMRQRGSNIGVVKGSEIVLAADGVANPTKVRYLYHNPWKGTLYSRSGLPVGPFEAEVKK